MNGPTDGKPLELFTRRLLLGGFWLLPIVQVMAVAQKPVLASQFPGPDGGAQIVAADRAIGSQPGEIWIDSSVGTTWSTAISLSGPRVLRFIDGGTYSIPLGNISWGYPVLVLGGGRRHTTLQFTGASGSAILANWAQWPSGSYADWGYGFRDVQILGPGGIDGGGTNAGVGIQIGDSTHATFGFRCENCVVAGFAIGLTWGNIGAWGSKFDHCDFLNNTQNFRWDLSPPHGGGLENVEFVHTVFGHTAKSPNFANDFQVQGTGVLELTCLECSFDNSQRNIAGSAFNQLRFVNTHTEVLAASSTVPLLISDGSVVDENPLFAADSTTTAPPAFVSVSGGNYSLSNGTWRAGKSGVVAILQSETGNITAINPLMFTSKVGGIQKRGSGHLTWFDSKNGFLSAGGSLEGTTLTATAATPTGEKSNLGLGNTTGFGNGAAGAAVTTTTKSTGSGPRDAQTVKQYLEIDIAGTKYWVPLMR